MYQTETFNTIEEAFAFRLGLGISGYHDSLEPKYCLNHWVVKWWRK